MRVAVLGYGYVGLELARTLIVDGHDMWDVRHFDDGLDAIETTGTEVIRADVTDADSLRMVPDAGHVVFATSSGGREANAARVVSVKGLRTAIGQSAARDSPPERLVYAPGTGVYGDHGGDFVDESTLLDLMTGKIRVLAETERVARERAVERGVEGTVTRFAGLHGSNRCWFERYLNGPVITGHLNMVRWDDVTGVIASLPETDHTRDDTTPVVGDELVSKHEFVDRLADECGAPRLEKRTKEEHLDAGDFSAIARRYTLASKHCSNDYLHELDYSFAYPTYREGYRVAIDAYRAGSDWPYSGDDGFEPPKFCHSGQFD